MITIIHGQDIVSSRKYFLDEKQKYSEAQLFDGEKITLTDLAQIFEGGNLFDDQKNVFIENFFSRKKSKTEFIFFVEYIQKQSTHNIYIWENKDLDKNSLIVFKSAIPKMFKLPQTLFLFLDELKPGNGKLLINLFHQTLNSTDVEMVFFMLVRQIRLLLSVSDLSQSQISEVKRLAPWQKNKLQQQVNLFTNQQLLNIYYNLFKLEVAQKTGNLSSPLASSIDFLLLEI